MNRRIGWVVSLALCAPLTSLLSLMGIALAGQATSLLHSLAPALVRSSTVVPVETIPPLPLASPSDREPPTEPNAPSFNSQQLDNQLRLYRRYVATVGRPDVLIVGSSRALQGVDPIALQRSLRQRGYPDPKIFNFGVNGATAQVVDLILRRLLTPDQLPRLIPWADGARAFNSGRLDRTYNRIAASQGYRQLVADCNRSTGKALTAGQRRLCTQPSNREPVKSFPRPSSLSTPQSQTNQSQATNSQATSQLETNGFNPLANRFNPTQYFRRYPKVPGAYDADYQAFTLSGKQTTAFNNVLIFARSQNIPVLFVSLPLTNIYLDGTRSTYERQFRAYMRQFAASRKLTFYDLSRRWINQHDYFTDPSHLNRYGAAAVSAQLGKDLLLPSAQP